MDARIAERLEHLPAEQAIETLLASNGILRPCLTCSFQAEGMALLHMVRKFVPDIPVLFLDTGYHFPETLAYRDRMKREWSLNLVTILPEKTVAQQESEFGLLYRSDPARCCQLRKVEPLARALEPFDIWFAGLRREQSPARRDIRKAALHQLPGGKVIWKLNPLADWTSQQVWAYLEEHGIERLPLYDQGYQSIGCAPCTSIPVDPANPRSGRWGGTRLECGIHTLGQPVPILDRIG